MKGYRGVLQRHVGLGRTDFDTLLKMCVFNQSQEWSTPVYIDELMYNPKPEHDEEEEEHSEDNQEVQPLEIDSTS